MKPMRVRHLNCASMVPPFLPAAVSPLPCHVLLCEAEPGLVLVDSGFGLDDYTDKKRLGPARLALKGQPQAELTARRQVEALGHRAEDVTDIVVTHLDLDHVGGISDFPHARIHTTAAEHAAAVTAPDWRDKQRYRTRQWAHGPQWVLHEGRGDAWRSGLTGHEVIPGITLVPMPGHSKGHAAVAVDAGERGLFVHAGDAAFDASVYGATGADGAPLEEIGLLRGFEKVIGRDRVAIAENHRTLARLHAEDGVTVVTAHDRRVLDPLLGVS